MPGHLGGVSKKDCLRQSSFYFRVARVNYFSLLPEVDKQTATSGQEVKGVMLGGQLPGDIFLSLLNGADLSAIPALLDMSHGEPAWTEIPWPLQGLAAMDSWS